MIDRREANLKMLNEAADTQNKTKDAIWRIQKQAEEAEGLGTQTLEELRRQGQQMDDINSELESVSAKLDQSQALQSRFDRWAGNWLGGKKRNAMKEAAAEIAERNQHEFSKVKEVFQHEKFDTLTRTWKRSGLVLCTDPNVTCDDLFDPAIQENSETTRWIVDFALNSIDSEGWTYSYDFATLNKSGAGDNEPKWNSYVRRRKWRYVDNRSSAGGAIDEINQRNDQRKQKTAQSKQSEKLGYVPRNKQAATLTATGLSSGGMTNRGKTADDQRLDADSAAGLAKIKETDAEIDAGIDAISRTIDNLNNIAGSMKDETVTQNAKLEEMERKMQTTTEKQTVVNARQRYLLK